MVRFGVICPAEIAYRRFMPALKQIGEAEYIGVAVNSAYERFGERYVPSEEKEDIIKKGTEKANRFRDTYGGIVFDSYEKMVESDEIDAIYIPLPPALHSVWAQKALEKGKHVLVEKPSTVSLADTKKLITLAEERDLALHENYMFIFHDQMSAIDEMIRSGRIGDVRLYSVRFGFPLREKNDFRYVEELGGGALLDAGGYTIKYASYLLGDKAYVSDAHMGYLEGFEVDMFGSGSLANENGLTVQISYGMDNEYKCELEVWGSKGRLFTNRILTAPPDLSPTVAISHNADTETLELPKDDAFGKSIKHFLECIKDKEKREKNRRAILKQAELVNEFRKQAEKNENRCDRG